MSLKPHPNIPVVLSALFGGMALGCGGMVVLSGPFARNPAGLGIFGAAVAAVAIGGGIFFQVKKLRADPAHG